MSWITQIESIGLPAEALRDCGAILPAGFVVSEEAYHHFLEAAGLEEVLQELFEALDPDDPNDVMVRSFKVRALVSKAELPADLAQQLSQAYQQLADSEEQANPSVTVRAPNSSEAVPFRGSKQLKEAVVKSYAASLTDAVMDMSRQPEMNFAELAMALTVQRFFAPESSGLLYNFEPSSGCTSVATAYSTWGLAEDIARKPLQRDEFLLHKELLKEGFEALLRSRAGNKEFILHYDSASHRMQHLPLSAEKARRLSLPAEQVLSLGRLANLLETHSGFPFFEAQWFCDERQQLCLVGVQSVEGPEKMVGRKVYRLQQPGPPLLGGQPAGYGLARGAVRIISEREQGEQFQSGEILVAESTQPDWEPFFRKAGAIVTVSDRRVSHATILAREMGIPALLQAQGCTSRLRDGQVVTVACCEGERGHVYEGEVAFQEEQFDLDVAQGLGVSLMVSLSQPEQALRLAREPWAGAGLVRSEFLIAGWVKVHPMALTDFDALSREVQGTVSRLCRGYPDRRQYFVDQMSQGLALIAAAFWPRPVRVRLSDLKSNEYARLVGGKQFEKNELNPALGWRGASRYLSPAYAEAFALELEAVQRVRTTMGLTNLHLIIPFCRTPEEGAGVLQVLEEHGLKQGERGLEVWLMAELPANVLLAREFAELFDGFSIGSNDLTQLVLGLDREAKLPGVSFDEQHPALLRAYQCLIDGAAAQGRTVSFCGQVASEPDFAARLAQMGISSLSLAPDALLPVWQKLAQLQVDSP